MEYVNKKLRAIKNILDKSYIKYNSPNTVYPHTVHGTHASQGKSQFMSLLSKMFLIVRNFFIWIVPTTEVGRPVGAVTLSRWEWWWNER